MNAGFLTATCLCFVLSQGASDIWYVNHRDPEFPVTIEENRRANIREMLLYTSSNQGRDWELACRITPEMKFRFYAPNDGMYWLSVATVNKSGVQEPDDKKVMAGGPQSKMMIDTRKPIVRTILAQREGDDVAVQWDVQEDNPDFSRDGMLLEYQAKDVPSGTWTPIPISASLKGQARFRAATKQPLVIRLMVRDLAKNVSHGFAETTGAVQATSFTPSGGGAPPGLPMELPLPKRPIEDRGPLTIPPPQVDVFGPKSVAPPPPMDVFGPKLVVLPPPPSVVGSEVPPTRLVAGASEPRITLPPQKEVPTERVIADTKMPPPPIAAPKLAPPGQGPAVADSGAPGKPVAVSAAAQRRLPALQYVNNHHVVLEYELKRVGPSGVGGIELWLTKDDGATWEQFAADEAVPSTPIHMRQKRKFDLELEPNKPFPDGVYGMNLVVKNRAGLGKKPRPGDVPEIRLEIDTKHPDAQLYQPIPDPQHPDQVLLRWVAEDKNLVAQPISLEYAKQRDGPWLAIQSDVENTGRYSWKVPPSTPVQVYLRLRVRDKAGNEGVAVTGEPQYIDLTEPEGALIGIQSQSQR